MQDATFRLDEHGITLTTAAGTGTTKWSEINAIHETEALFVLVLGDERVKQETCIPKSTGAGNVTDAIEELLAYYTAHPIEPAKEALELKGKRNTLLLIVVGTVLVLYFLLKNQ